MSEVPGHQKIILAGLLSIALLRSAECQQLKKMDAQEWLVQKGILKPRRSKKNFLFLLPVIGINPTAGFIYGLGLTYADIPIASGARSSNFSSNASYSTRGLANFNIKSNLFVIKDRLFLNGDWRYFVISEITYGLGSDTHNPGQSLRYRLGRFHETASWRLVPNIFAGIGIHFDRQFRIDDQTADTGGQAVSYHYLYSTDHNLDPLKYTTNGVSLNFLFDNRDNPLNTYKGYYINLNYRINSTLIGSNRNSALFLADCRAFFPLDGARERHVLGFWGYANFVTSGNLPYLMLPAIGYDQRQKSGRGYTFGRFRGERLVYGESEYRYPISTGSNILGGVLFVNIVSTSDQYRRIPILEYLQPAFGAGLRLLLDKTSRTRLQLDGAIGNSKPALYFGIRETF